MTLLWHVILDDACALANTTQGMLPRTACQFCAASRILKPSSFDDISHPCHPYDHITYVSMFTAKGENMHLRTLSLATDKTQLSLSLCARCLLDVIKKITALSGYCPCKARQINPPFQDRAPLGSKGV